MHNDNQETLYNQDTLYYDLQDYKRRVSSLKKHILPDVANVTNGRVSLQTLINAESSLDIGMGTGAYAQAMRELSSNGRFVGVDLRKYPGQNGYTQYEDLIIGDIRNPEILTSVNQYSFNCVLGISPDLKVLEFVANNRVKFNMLPGGLIVFITEHDIAHDLYRDFDVFRGTIPLIDKSILVSKIK